MIAPTLAFTFKCLRKYRGLTQMQLSELCGISVSYLSDIERGKANPTIATLIKIAGALGYEIGFKLKGRDDEPNTN